MERILPERTLIDHIEVNLTKEDVLRKMGMPADHRLGDSVAKVIEDSKFTHNFSNLIMLKLSFQITTKLQY